ncbi:hypothetical protein N7509_012874 [Penicillium cosmopolitanum]|uniref:Uncharacterized protein n=1 Tax=Penicillium cosmopolitanum TaxID=1131564 RepID=A0A9W9SGZ6_9EURO|nr:uncharacterized protein N7509_012874 [Penicillium cosmopolitanum]KAJ5375988.1 hypothetical protein N7509_012874 [Penicillium cosmopolitanum]
MSADLQWFGDEVQRRDDWANQQREEVTGARNLAMCPICRHWAESGVDPLRAEANVSAGCYRTNGWTC